MKTTIATIATLFTLAFGFHASAKETANPLKKLDSKAIALTYLQTISTGNVLYNKHLYTNDFEYRNSSNDQVSNKTQYLRFLKENKGLQYDCKTSYEILDEAGNTAVGKATMTFKNFTRIDYITMLQTADGWKVSKVVTTYP
ncbi:nuclear transport factor 2 family protein [Sphingobacterium paucimobilis]|uniref:DUF4878 domain-containing protein n=1 Tax=Sphingobacterium paucimobilis HER1398 TaxID=1346330 RepID=U2HS98_9SPHI|nr:nuclear transport factor 2 family protein [Sphingobacterium paucimobilis]ERJ58150.1 hypothetical protein M472_05170 [Sphingobacterium paucimobilis HER1398]